VARATALFHAVHGDARATEAVAAWTRAGGQPEQDIWPQLAAPMLELNKPQRDPKGLQAALATLKEITDHENDFGRAYILLARARIDVKDYEGADEALEKVLSLRKEHSFASDLKRRVAEAREEKTPVGAAPAPAPAPAP
jgi:hypothetical protein